jgi:hypothetical protein
MKRSVGFLAVMLLAGCKTARVGSTQHDSVHFDLDKSEVTRVELRMSAGELMVKGGSSRLVEADFTYNVADWKPKTEYHSTGSRGDLVISQADSASGFGDTENRWDVRLNEKSVLDISAKLGAGEAHMDFGTLNLRGVDVQMGAGELNLDLRGHPTRSYDVRVQGGVGEATIYLPRDVGISARAEGGIGEIKTTGLAERNGRWINPSRENSPITIRLDVKGGVGQINLIAE